MSPRSSTPLGANSTSCGGRQFNENNTPEAKRYSDIKVFHGDGTVVTEDFSHINGIATEKFAEGEARQDDPGNITALVTDGKTRVPVDGEKTIPHKN